jgi:hypothetical protein
MVAPNNWGDSRYPGWSGVIHQEHPRDCRSSETPQTQAVTRWGRNSTSLPYLPIFYYIAFSMFESKGCVNILETWTSLKWNF